MTGAQGPLRRCVGCRRVRPRAELRRFVRTSQGVVVPGANVEGRGAWLCPGSAACADAAVAHRAFERAFKRPCRTPLVHELLIDP